MVPLCQVSHVLLYCCSAGIITVTNAGTSSFLGYVSRTYNSFNEFDLTTDPANALSVTVTLGSTHNIIENNGPAPGTYPFLGFVRGVSSTSNDLAAGSYNYLFLTSTAITPPNSPPADVGNSYNAGFSSESAIWTADANFFITAQWVNTDSSQPPTLFLYLGQNNLIVATGDRAAFNAEFDYSAPVVNLQIV
jgi:hypothetical protein